eukprot:3982048-Alexandrium_andersonii.AAC.1
MVAQRTSGAIASGLPGALCGARIWHCVVPVHLAQPWSCLPQAATELQEQSPGNKYDPHNRCCET